MNVNIAIGIFIFVMNSIQVSSKEYVMNTIFLLAVYTPKNVSMRRFFWASKTFIKTEGLENIYKLMLQIYVKWVLQWRRPLRSCQVTIYTTGWMNAMKGSCNKFI